MAGILTSAKVFAIASVMTVLALVSGANAATYYVSTTGDNGALGTSADAAWRTIAYAAGRAVAGDTVYVKGGDYGFESVTPPGGYAGHPIVFEGYDGTPKLQRPEPRSGTFSGNNGFYLNSVSYVTIRNFEIVGYLNCVYIYNCTNITIENVNCHDCGWTGSSGYGIAVVNSINCTLKDCTVTDSGGSDYQIQACDYITLDGCKAYGTRVSSDTYATDYYIILAWSSNNTVINCIAEDKAKSQKGNHGIGIKDGGTSTHEHSTGNQFINCKAYAFEEGIFAAHEAHHNTYTNCLGDSSQKNYYFNNGIMVRDGAKYNTFNNCTAIGSPGALCMYVYEDLGGSADSTTQSYNQFIGCTFISRGAWSSQCCMWMRNAQNNVFDTCSFVNSAALTWFAKDNDGIDKNSGNTFLNCTIYNLPQLVNTNSLYFPPNMSTPTAGYDDSADLVFQYCNFWLNGFSTPAGVGNTSIEPHFVDPEHDDFRLQMPLVWVDFVFGGNEIGTETEPFKTLDSGILWVIPGGTIRIKAGARNQAVRMTKPMRIESSGGTATIGRN